MEYIIYRNVDNGYSVFYLSDVEDIPFVGNIFSLEIGMYVEIKGEIIYNSKYGEQIKVLSIEEKTPSDIIAIKKYLSSGIIKGIGEKTAERIIEKFKEDSLLVMEEEPERLSEIKGISLNKALKIGEEMRKNNGQRKAMLYLTKFDISTNIAIKIYKEYGEKLYKILEENPYKLSSDIEGIGFKKADEIAGKIGLDPYSDFRIKEGIMDRVRNSSLEGHTYIEIEALYNETKKLLEISLDEELFVDLVHNLYFEKVVVISKKLIENKEKNVVSLSSIYYAEENSAKMLLELDDSIDIDKNLIIERINKYEKNHKIKFDPIQKEAILNAITNNVFIISGGPGTGKTTIIKAIIRILSEFSLNIALAAPTGRAAKKMEEACGYTAKTIHRLLEVDISKTDDRGFTFGRNKERPIESDVIIIDESSMIDVYLLNSLLEAIKEGSHIIFIGDVNQLPSVGPGNILRDMISSNIFKCVKLEKIFRQRESGNIVKNAYLVNNGKRIDDNKYEDFFFINEENEVNIRKYIEILIMEKIPSHFHIDPFDIQVLSPTKKGICGTRELNRHLQSIINPKSDNKREYEKNWRTYREGDKVMQTKNNYQIIWEVKHKGKVIEEGNGIYNGDLGIIKEIDKCHEEITVLFDDNKEVVYPYGELEELELAYAITIHKSQGSEYPAVLIPIFNVPFIMRYRKLIYTGITRGKHCVAIIGSSSDLNEMIENRYEKNRNTLFKEKFSDIYKKMDSFTDIS